MDTALTEFTFAVNIGKWLIPIFTLTSRTSFIVTCGMLIIVCAIISLIFGAMSGRYAAIAASGYSMNLRKKLFYKIENFSFANLDRYNTASLITRLTTDVTNVQMSYMMIIRLLVRAPIMLILALIMAISINAELSVVFAIAIPILIVGLVLGVKVVYPRFMKMLDKYDAMNESTQENLTGIRAVKAYVREDYETKRFQKVSAEVSRLQFKAEKVLVVAMPFMQIVIYACVVAIVGLGGNKIIAGDMLVGSMSAFLTYVMQILMSLGMVAMVAVMIVMSRASAERICEVINEDIDIKSNPNASEEKPVDGSIDFENVDFSYSKNPEILNLENIDLHIKSGETIGIIGGTGSAKTTLVQLIPRLYDVLDGVVKVGGKDVREYSIKTLRDSVAMVLQQNVLFSGTIKENLKWGNMEATDEEIVSAAKAACADDFIMSFKNGYDTNLGQGGVNVSGGQKQRLCIARALLKKPKIMILDDSTSAVDTATDSKIRASFKKEFAETTVLIIAQRVASIEQADRIIVMSDGKINAIGTHDELLKSNDIYREVCLSQKRGQTMSKKIKKDKKRTALKG
ncbi:MAG: ABC transporter ATP-binding protein, partial [Clostridia bacterium]